jgi:hypothetical protein
MVQYFLRLDTEGIGSIRSFILDENPLYVYPVSAFDEGKVNRKWLDYEGILKPGEKYNPLKKLPTRMSILATGYADYETEKTEEGAERITLKFTSGAMKGTWILEQEEEEADTYIFAPAKELTAGRFVLQRHGIPEDDSYRWHYDLRWDTGKGYIEEFNLYGNPLEEEVIPAVRKTCRDPTWMEIEEPTKRKVGEIWTLVEPVDGGKITVIEDSENFISMFLSGVALTGYWVAKKDEEGWKLIKSKLPRPVKLEEELAEGDPSTGEYFFKVERKKGWDYFILHLYDLRRFSRAEPDRKVKKYLPDLQIPEGVVLTIALYPVPGTIHHARVANVRFPESWSEEEAISWVKKNKLHTWESEMIKE